MFILQFFDSSNDEYLNQKLVHDISNLNRLFNLFILILHVFTRLAAVVVIAKFTVYVSIYTIFGKGDYSPLQKTFR